MKAKHKDILLVLLFIPIIAIISSKSIDHLEDLWFWILPFVFGSLFSFNLIVKNNPAFKPYFTSKFNYFTSKYRSKITSDIPQDLMFEKMLEVIQNAPFTLKNSNKQTHEILASASISWKSWGENIYIDFETTTDHQTVMHFCSASFSGITSWGKNESNYEKMLAQFEESLTI